MSDERKRTVRAQVTNGALEARAYAEPRSVARSDAHRTFKMQKVEVDPNVDPRMRKTVARGMGEQVSAIEGDIVDPETGRVLPPVGADPNPTSPWRVGKRPTHVKLPRPDVRTAATAGVARSRDAEPSRLVWVAAAVIVAAAIGAAVFLGGRVRDEGVKAASSADRPTAAPASDREPRSAAPAAEATAAAPSAAAPMVGAPTVAPTAASAPTGAATPATAAPRLGGTSAPPPPTGSAKAGGRIF